MTEKKFEDIFKEGFNNFEQMPSQDTWKRIHSQLWWDGIANSLKNMVVNPSSNLWYKLSIQLALLNFLRFKPTSFNVYYLTAGFIGLIGIFTLTNQEVKNAQYIQNQTVSHNIIYPENHNVITNNISVLDNPLVSNFIAENKSNNEQSIVSKQEIELKQNKENVPVFVEMSQEVNPLTYLELLEPSTFPNDLNVDLNGDTIGFNWQGIPIINNPFKWSLDAYGCYETNILANQIETTPANDKIGNSNLFNSSPSFVAGLGINFQKANFMFSTGISYRQFQLESNYNRLTYRLETTYQTIVNESNILVYDTLWVLQLDSFINGNPVYIPFVDSHYVHVIDSTVIESIVSKKEIESKKAIQTLGYAEVPISVAYKFSKGRLDFGTRMSFYTGILTYMYGEIKNPHAAYGAVSTDSKIFKTYLFSLGASFEAQYHITARAGIIIEPFYRKNLNSIFVNDFPVNVKNNSYGCKFALRYHF